MKAIRRTSQFKRDVKRMQRQGRDLEKLKKVLETLAGEGHNILMSWTTTIRIPLARDLSLSSPRPKLEKMENARTKGLLVPRSNGTDIEHWVSARAVGPFKIATGTQGRLGTPIVALC